MFLLFLHAAHRKNQPAVLSVFAFWPFAEPSHGIAAMTMEALRRGTANTV